MKKNLKYLSKLILLFLILLIVYILLIQTWSITSEYKPVGLLDHATRTGPENIEDWTSNRRLHN